MHSTNKTAKPGNLPPLQATRLLDQLRERIRYRHYSIRTEQAYVYWVRYFVRWHGIRHPARHPFAAIRIRHQNSTAASWTFGRKHNDGLYPRAEPWRARREKSA